MNRRSFLGRAALIGSALPALGLAKDISQRPGGDGHAPSATGLDGVSSAGLSPLPAPRESAPTRYELLHARHLLDPCPNCGQIAWDPVAFATDRALCQRCGWRDEATAFVRRCDCIDCVRPFGGARARSAVLPTRTRAEIDLEVPPGAYVVADAHGHEVRQTQLNAYDITADRWIHHAVSQLGARVRCAVWLSNHPDRVQVHGVEDSYRRPNGDQVILAWATLDCLEWQQARGEAPRTVIHLYPCGHETRRQMTWKDDDDARLGPPVFPFPDQCPTCGAQW